MSVERFKPARGKRAADWRSIASKIKLEHNPWGQVVLIGADGQRYVIEPVRAFPFSDPEHWVSLRDAHGWELLFIEDLAKLDARSRAVLEAELARREFVPIIQSIQHISAATEPCEWQVTTDRGMTRFMLNSEDDVRALSACRVLITDVNGMRYVIPDKRVLDAASHRWLERYA